MKLRVSPNFCVRGTWSLIFWPRHVPAECMWIFIDCNDNGTEQDIQAGWMLSSSVRVHSEVNLLSFKVYCVHYAQENEWSRLKKAFLTVHIGEYGRGYFPCFVCQGKFGDWHMDYHICDDAQCPRCFLKAGGYRFPWVGPWTPLGAYRETWESAEEVRTRCVTHRWPWGCLRPPQGGEIWV